MMKWTEKDIAFAYLSRVVEGPSREINELLAAGRSAPEIATAIRHREAWLGEKLLRTTLSRYQDVRPQEDLRAVEALGGRLIYPGHEEWPGEELEQAFGYATHAHADNPRAQQADAVAPHALWVTGAPLPPLVARAVAIVGTRAPSRYGTCAATLLAEGLCDHQWAIISGGALGIDTAAHRAALQRGGATIVVAAQGLGRIYPRANEGLFHDIREHGGAIVTEYPPGAPPQRHRFLTRNRLVAALSQGTVVVQAAWRSGALNTLSWASALGRVAMAVPGPITDALALGCHARLRDGEAQLVTSADDIRALVGRLGDVDADAQHEIDFAATEIQRLSRDELRIYDALPQHGGDRAEAISRRAGLSLALTVHLLVVLKKQGLVQLDGTQWKRVPCRVD